MKSQKTSIVLSQEDLNLLEELKKKMGENKSKILSRGLLILNEKYNNKMEKKEK